MFKTTAFCRPIIQEAEYIQNVLWNDRLFTRLINPLCQTTSQIFRLYLFIYLFHYFATHNELQAE